MSRVMCKNTTADNEGKVDPPQDHPTHPMTKLLKIVAFRHGRLNPPTYGALIRASKILSHFAKRGHAVSLFYYGTADRSFKADGIHYVEIRNPFHSLSAIGQAIYRGVEGRWAFELAANLIPRMASAARDQVKDCDVVYVEHIWSSPFPLIYARMYGKPLIVDDHNVETLLARRAMQEARGITQTLLAFLLAFVIPVSLNGAAASPATASQLAPVAQ